jgi:hypothetical protein
MLRPWQSTLHVTTSDARLLVTESSRDLLKARLDLSPRHPRALLTLLEGLSLWSGEPLRVALSVDESCPAGLEPTLLGDGLWPAESALVQFEVVRHVRPKHLDAREFRALRRIARGGAR